jgi:hypothetical protein
MQGVVRDITLIQAGGLGLLFTLALMIRLRRGRRVGDHPSCRKCGHDLFGLPETSACCPECGADLTRRRAKLDGIYAPSAWRWGRRAMLLAALGVVGTGVWQAINEVGYLPYQPDLVLLYWVERGDMRSRSAADELVHRCLNGQLGWASATWVNRRAEAWMLRSLAGPRPPNSPKLELIEMLHGRGEISPDVWRRCVGLAVSDPGAEWWFASSGRTRDPRLLIYEIPGAPRRTTFTGVQLIWPRSRVQYTAVRLDLRRVRLTHDGALLALLPEPETNDLGFRGITSSTRRLIESLNWQVDLEGEIHATESREVPGRPGWYQDELIFSRPFKVPVR